MKTIEEKNGPFGYRKFSQDERGQWTMEIPAYNVKELVRESEVIDALKDSPEWKAIRNEHFPMYGFHN